MDVVPSLGKSESRLVMAVFSLAAIMASVLIYNHQKIKRTSNSTTQQEQLTISPVSPDFNWRETEPHKQRPFKNGAYKLTMGIKKLDPNDWLLIEKTYLDRIEAKSNIVNDPEDKKETVFLSDDCVPALNELYSFVITWLCERYPMYFTKDFARDKVFNSIKNEHIPLNPEIVDSQKLIRILAGTIEEDFIILFKDKQDEEYIFKGGVFAFAAGFKPSERFQTPLTTVHGPVPGYKTKLQFSMNKFFNRIKAGEFINRNNWSIQTHDKIFTTGNNKGATTEKIVPKLAKELNFQKDVFFRSERQTLTRLPVTNAIIFTIRTYLVPMSHIREEGSAHDLCGAIDGLPEDIGHYKRKPEWGEAIKSYLNFETDGVIE